MVLKLSSIKKSKLTCARELESKNRCQTSWIESSAVVRWSKITQEDNDFISMGMDTIA